MLRKLAVVLFVASILFIEGCSGRFVTDSNGIRSISLVSYTSNSWFGWRNQFPLPEHLFLDLVSASVYASTERGDGFNKISSDYKSGKLDPGHTVSLYGVQVLRDYFAGRKDFFTVEMLGENPVLRMNSSPVTFTSEYLRLIPSSAPEKYKATAEQMLHYITSAEPQWRSKPDGMPLVILNDTRGEGIPEIIHSLGAANQGYLFINASYVKEGDTPGGSGSGRVRCTVRAVVFNSSGEAVWKTRTRGTGSSFRSEAYLPLIWTELEISAEEATKEAVKELAYQLGQDFN